MVPSQLQQRHLSWCVLALIFFAPSSEGWLSQNPLQTVSNQQQHQQHQNPTCLFSSTRYRRPQSPYDDYFEEEDRRAEEKRRKRYDPPSFEPDEPEDPFSRDYYGDDEYEYDPYEEEEEEEEYEYVTPPPRVEWEEVRVPDSDGGFTSAFVLLPPSPPSMHPLPRAVVHFVGGVMFGSAPKLFYRTLLESIVEHTQCAIVVTPLPVITPLNSRQKGGPLDHNIRAIPNRTDDCTPGSGGHSTEK